MEKLANLEAERGNPEYISGNEIKDTAPRTRRKTGSGTDSMHSYKRERTASKEMCDFLILNISSL